MLTALSKRTLPRLDPACPDETAAARPQPNGGGRHSVATKNLQKGLRWLFSKC